MDQTLIRLKPGLKRSELRDIERRCSFFAPSLGFMSGTGCTLHCGASLNSGVMRQTRVSRIPQLLGRRFRDACLSFILLNSVDAR